MKVAILVDGAFLRVKHRQLHSGRYPTAEYVHELCVKRLMSTQQLKDDFLFRVYYYDCHPFVGTLRNPITSEETEYTVPTTFLEALGHKDHFQVRAGEIKFGGWRLSDDCLKKIIDEGRTIEGDDLQPAFQQKQVDMNIGLDIAWLSQKHIVEKVILITADSDFVPAMEFARREGILLYLVHFDSNIKGAMLENCDGVIRLDPMDPFIPALPTDRSQNFAVCENDS